MGKADISEQAEQPPVSQGTVPGPGNGTAAGSASGSVKAPPRTVHPWRRLFQRQLNVSIVSFAGLLTLLGLVVLVLDLTAIHGVFATVFLEVAVTLILFGITTLFVTVAVADALETRLETSITEILESEKQEIIKLSKVTKRAVLATQEELRPLGGNWRALGLTNVYLTRSDALDEFGDHIRSELHYAEDRRRAARRSQNGQAGPDPGQAGPDRGEVGPDRGEAGPDPGQAGPDRGEVGPDLGEAGTDTGQADPQMPRLWIAASSMKGLLESASKQFDGLGIFTWAAELACAGVLDLRILMTHPDFAKRRADQEERGSNAIPEEIQQAVNHLSRMNVPATHVRMMVATPTVFAITTRDQMLLNPYPYSQEAYRSFTLTVRRSQGRREIQSIDRDIFEQYERRHFNRPWENAWPLQEDYGIPPYPGDGSHPRAGAGPAMDSAVNGRVSARTPAEE